MKKFLRISGFVLAALATLVALGYAIENWRGARAWSAEQARIRTSGEPLVWPDLVPPPPPPERNFAAVPLFEGLFAYEAVRDVRGPNRRLWKGGPVQTRLSQTFLLPNPPKSAPPTEPSPNPALDFASTLGQLQNGTNYPSITPSGKPAQDILRLLESRKDAFDQLRLAAARPECRFGIRYDDNFEALLPHLAVLKGAAQLLRIRSAALLATGDRAAAADDVLLILRLGDVAGSDPILISMLVRIAIHSIAASAVWEGWQQDLWKPEDYQRFQAAFVAFNPRDALVDALRSERLFSTGLIDLLKDEPARYIAAFGNGEEASVPVALRVAPGGWLRFNQAALSRCLDGLAQQARATSATGALSSIPGPADLKDLGPMPYTFMARMLVPAVSRAFAKADRSRANIHLVTTVCALERFRADHGGRLPESLAALAPEYLASVPIDPMSGTGLVYQPAADGSFRLYSVGANARDDGGAGASKGHTEPLDWAWPPRKASGDSHRF